MLKMDISTETEQQQQSVRPLHEQQLVLIKANAASAVVLDVSSLHQSFLSLQLLSLVKTAA